MKRTSHPSGDFHCTWRVRAGEGGTTSYPGTLAVHPGERPAGEIRDIDLSEPGGLIPNRREYATLTATFSRGASATVLGDTRDPLDIIRTNR